MFSGKEVLVRYDRTLNPEKNVAMEQEVFAKVEASELPESVRFWVDTECLVRGKVKNVRYGWYHEGLARRLGVRVVQRETGGGVVYHDRGNLNWSIFVRSAGPFHSPAKLFGQASGYIVRALERLGVPARFAPPNRVDVGGYKVSGMAARATPRALLVHGTLLLNTDLDRLNLLCIPPPGCPPVANVSRWVGDVRARSLVDATVQVLKDSGMKVRLRTPSVA
ncbi:MAG: hypothetical protein JRN27_08560 [Nitrososphaerota archaeon]|jgi:lipoate-protein ligase A|nr:hypothetical protein [Nitrososphaerota archaeon]MDG6955372.1 hypothetical protein [Nitrososphaerota archaeon]MDG6965027.1 hypothetical protein [Nitrososphaerota archaeon]MDG6976126.1 hypothetical protein [Nitrososphaerota archaeon]